MANEVRMSSVGELGAADSDDFAIKTVDSDGVVQRTALSIDQDTAGVVTVRPTAAQTTATKAVAATESGTMFVDTQGTGTTTFNLPAAAAGLWYTFVCGHAGGEILITPATGDAIVGKTHGAENGTGIAPAAGTGIKNTAATNVIGDFCTLVCLDGTTWYMTAVAGVWASQ